MAKKRELVTREMTIADAISEAYGTLEGLGEEMRESFDNTPESLQSGVAGTARGEAADALESLTEPSVDDKMGAHTFKYQSFPPKRRQSRSDRRNEATALLDAVLQEIEELQEKEGDKQEWEDLHTEVENLKDEADAVDFPGMYG